MLRFMLLSLALIGFINSSNIPKTAPSPAPASYHQSYDTYVKTACNVTTYPTTCYNSLSPYSSTIKSDPIKLCTTSLSLNIKAVKKATSIVSNLLKKAKSIPDIEGLQNCLEWMDLEIDSIKDSIPEMKSLRHGGGGDPAIRLHNAITWMRAALTYEDTCTEEMEEGQANVELKKMMKNVVGELSMTTSNTLAFVAKYPHF